MIGKEMQWADVVGAVELRSPGFHLFILGSYLAVVFTLVCVLSYLSSSFYVISQDF